MSHALYIFEGVDGSGKTTLSKIFAERMGGVYYKGLPKILRPYKNFVDKNLPAFLRYAFYTLGNKISYKEIAKLLKNTDVIVDQFIYCTIAFHTVSMGKKLRVPAIPLSPDKIIYLNTESWNEIDARLDKRGGRKKLEELDYLKEVDGIYQEVFSDMKNVIFFSNSKTIEESIEKLMTAIKN